MSILAMGVSSDDTTLATDVAAEPWLPLGVSVWSEVALPNNTLDVQ